MKLLRKYNNAASANVAKSLLQSFGIETYLAEPPVVLKLGNFRLMIVDERFDEAMTILTDHKDRFALPDDFVPPADSDAEAAIVNE